MVYNFAYSVDFINLSNPPAQNILLNGTFYKILTQPFISVAVRISAKIYSPSIFNVAETTEFPDTTLIAKLVDSEN